MHTKDKGAIAETFVIADLAQRGYKIALPIGENIPFDLIAIRDDYSLLRIQVKYRRLDSNGSVSIKLASTWKNSAITRVVAYDLNAIDYFAIYCPDVKQVAYVPVAELKRNRVFAIRVTPAKNKQSKGVRSFEAYSSL